MRRASHQIASAGGLSGYDIGALNDRLRPSLHNRGEYRTPIELVAQRLTAEA